MVCAYVPNPRMFLRGKFDHLVKSKSYENYCPTDFSAPIFMKYFWNFCKAHESNLPLKDVAITGIPIVATLQTSSSTIMATTSIKHSFFPSGGSMLMDYFSIWIIIASMVLSFGVILA